MKINTPSKIDAIVYNVKFFIFSLPILGLSLSNLHWSGQQHPPVLPPSPLRWTERWWTSCSKDRPLGPSRPLWPPDPVRESGTGRPQGIWVQGSVSSENYGKECGRWGVRGWVEPNREPETHQTLEPTETLPWTRRTGTSEGDVSTSRHRTPEWEDRLDLRPRYIRVWPQTNMYREVWSGFRLMFSTNWTVLI